MRRERLVDRPLYVFLFRRRLDDHVAVTEAGIVGAGGHPRQRRRLIFGRDHRARDLAFHVAIHGRHRAVERIGLHIEQNNGKSGQRADMGNAIAHLASPDHANPGDNRGCQHSVGGLCAAQDLHVHRISTFVQAFFSSAASSGSAVNRSATRP